MGLFGWDKSPDDMLSVLLSWLCYCWRLPLLDAVLLQLDWSWVSSPQHTCQRDLPELSSGWDELSSMHCFAYSADLLWCAELCAWADALTSLALPKRWGSKESPESECEMTGSQVKSMMMNEKWQEGWNPISKGIDIKTSCIWCRRLRSRRCDGGKSKDVLGTEQEREVWASFPNVDKRKKVYLCLNIENGFVTLLLLLWKSRNHKNLTTITTWF